VFELAKTVHALDSTATVVGNTTIYATANSIVTAIATNVTSSIVTTSAATTTTTTNNNNKYISVLYVYVLPEDAAGTSYRVSTTKLPESEPNNTEM
jgi:hypothetical protein